MRLTLLALAFVLFHSLPLKAEDRACFSNSDCASEESCQNIGTPDQPKAVCQVGERGKVLAGEGCQSEKDCESGVCIETPTGGLCSASCSQTLQCSSPAAPRCVTLNINDVPQGWCFPQSSR